MSTKNFLLFIIALSLAVPIARAQSSLVQGENPQPGTVVRLDSADRLIFSKGIRMKGALKWTISNSISPAPGSGGVSMVSQEAGPLTEKSFYEWDPKTRTFWIGWRDMVEYETLVSDSRNDLGISQTKGGMTAVPRAECLDTFQDAPPDFVAQMKQLIRDAAGQGN
jgi:hypothetical protein